MLPGKNITISNWWRRPKNYRTVKWLPFVLPQFIKHDDHLAFVKNEYNGVVIESGFADKQFFYGKGAGSFPTASAVLSDLSALRYQYKYEYKNFTTIHHRSSPMISTCAYTLVSTTGNSFPKTSSNGSKNGMQKQTANTW